MCRHRCHRCCCCVDDGVRAELSHCTPCQCHLFARAARERGGVDKERGSDEPQISCRDRKVPRRASQCSSVCGASPLLLHDHCRQLTPRVRHTGLSTLGKKKLARQRKTTAFCYCDIVFALVRCCITVTLHALLYPCKNHAHIACLITVKLAFSLTFISIFHGGLPPKYRQALIGLLY